MTQGVFSKEEIDNIRKYVENIAVYYRCFIFKTPLEPGKRGSFIQFEASIRAINAFLDAAEKVAPNEPVKEGTK